MHGDNRRSAYDLQRFVAAQEGTYEAALAEIRAGCKQSHWMWFVFPQIAGLGVSATSARYAIQDLEEARAYLQHPILGPRLREIARAALAVNGKTALEIFGSPDDMKLRSSATLFAQAAEAGSVFDDLLAKYFGAKPDSQTLRILQQV